MEFAESKPNNADIRISLTTGTLGEILTVSSEGDKHSPMVLTPMEKLLAAIDSKKAKLTTGDTDNLNKFFSYFDSQSVEKFPITLK